MKQLGFPSLSTRALGPHAPVSSREKHHFSSSQCFLLTGPKLHFVNSHPHSSAQKTRNLPLGKWDSLKGASGCSVAVSFRSHRTSCIHLELELEPPECGPEQRKLSQKDIIGHYIGIDTMFVLESTHQWSAK